LIHFLTQSVTKNKKHMKYPLVGDGVSSLKFGWSPSFEQSLFTDTDLDTCELDQSRMKQRTEREKTHLYRRYFSLIIGGRLMLEMVIKYSIVVYLSLS